MKQEKAHELQQKAEVTVKLNHRELYLGKFSTSVIPIFKWQIFDSKRMGESRNMIAGLYDLEETIGEGHYAVVKLAR